MGSKVKDRVTGLVGIATARIEYLNGCIQYGVKPPVDKKTGKLEDAHYIDDQQLEVVGRGVSVAAPEKPPGGPSSDTPSGEYRG